MTKYYDPGETWNDLELVTWQYTNTWYNIAGYWTPGSQNSFTTPAQDLGTSQWVLPTTVIASEAVGSSSEWTVNYLVSDDGSTYTSQPVGAIKGRFIKTQVAVTMFSGEEGIQAVNTTFTAPVKTWVLAATDTSTLAGSDSATTSLAASKGVTTPHTINLSTEFSRISAVKIDPSLDETRPLSIKIIDSSPANFTFGLIDNGTWGNVSTDADITLTVTGFPRVVLDSKTGTVSIA